MVSRKEKEIEFRENLIIEAAEKLFLESGFENTKMEDIAAEADYTKPTLYKYFKCKEEILLAVYMRGWNRSFDLIKKATESKEKGYDKLLAVAKSYNRFFSKNSIYFSLLKYVHDKGIKLCDSNQKREQDFEQESKKKMKLFTEITKKGIHDGSIAAEIEPKIAVNYFLNNLYINMHTKYNKQDVSKDFLRKATKMMMRVFK